VGGVTVADFDVDGRPDVLLTISQPRPPALLLNRGGRFEDAAMAWGLGGLNGTFISAAADFDGDGDPDLVVGAMYSPLRLFRNDGMRFTEVPPGFGGSDRDAMVIAPADLDRDGMLDLVVGWYRIGTGCPPILGVYGCPGIVGAMRQVAPWRFETVTVDAPRRRVQALRVADWDGDGRDEVLAGADVGMISGGNQLLRVEPGPGGVGFALRDATVGSGFDHEVLSMGVALVDADEDGRDEVLVTNLGWPLLLRRASGVVTDVGRMLMPDSFGLLVPGQMPHYRYFDPENLREAALARFQEEYLDEHSPLFPSTKWVPIVFDYDHDGHDDVFIPSGRVGIPEYPELSAQPALMLRGTGSRLVDVAASLHLQERRDAYSAAAADFDGDGDLDLVVLHAGVDAPARPVLLRNDAAAGRALTVVARGRGAARDGIGAVVEVRANGRRSRHRVDGNTSIFGTGPHQVHVGLGAATGADEVVVTFPSGAVVRRVAVPAGRLVVEE
jgi:hypothetical protein